MHKIIKAKSYVFEAEPPIDAINFLEKWGRLVKKGEVYIYTIEMGDIKSKKIEDSPTKSVKRIYINSGCGCVLEIDEIKDFDNEKTTYTIYKKKICKTHQEINDSASASEPVERP